MTGREWQSYDEEIANGDMTSIHYTCLHTHDVLRPTPMYRLTVMADDLRPSYRPMLQNHADDRQRSDRLAFLELPLMSTLVSHDLTQTQGTSRYNVSNFSLKSSSLPMQHQPLETTSLYLSTLATKLISPSSSTTTTTTTTISSSSSSLSLSALPAACFVFLLLLSSMSVLALEDAVTTNHGVVRQREPLPLNCYRHFGHRLQSCVDPFTSLLRLYYAKSDQLSNPTAVAKHICIEYQMVLMCLHSSLTDCPTLRNLRRVQNLLDARWVDQINILCAIQPKESENLSTQDYDDLANYVYKQKSPNHVNAGDIAQQILENSARTRAELEEEIVSAKADDVFGNTITESRTRHFPTLQKELSNLETAFTDNSKSSLVQFNIVSFIQNYNNYDTDTEAIGSAKGKHSERNYVIQDLGHSSAGRVKSWMLTFLMFGLFVIVQYN